MPISSRLVVRSTILLLGVGFFTLVGIVLATIWLGERAHYSFNEVIEARETRSAAVELRAALQTAESSQRGFIITGNEIYLAPYDNAKTQSLRRLEILKRRLAGDAQSAKLVARLNNAAAEKIKELDETIKLKSGRSDQEALAILQSNRGKAVMDEINLFLTGLIRRTDDKMTGAVNEQRANAAWLRWVSIFGGLVIVLVVGGVTTLMLRYAGEVVNFLRGKDEPDRTLTSYSRHDEGSIK